MTSRVYLDAMKTKRYSETLCKVAPVLAEHKHGQMILRELALHERSAGEGAEFDIAEALYWIGNHYHDGQFSVWYRVLCLCGFNPGAMARGPEIESTAQYLYETIETILNN